MLSLNKNYLISFIFVLVFVFSRSIYSIITESDISLLYGILLTLYLIFFFIIKDEIFKRKYKNPLIFTCVFLIFGVLNYVYTNELNLFRFIGPLSAFIGFVFYEKYKLNFDTRVFIIFFVFYYLYYYFSYYQNLPSLLNRIDFNEDTYIFDNSSSNAIPISLNLFLATYILFKSNSSKPTISRDILFFSIFNLIYILIQQSRLGIITSLIILFYVIKSLNINNKFTKVFSYLIFIGVAILFTDILTQIYINSGLESLVQNKENVRMLIILNFFGSLSIENLFFGLGKTIFLYISDIPQYYTYNILSEIVRMYGIVPLILLLKFIQQRVKNRKFFFNNYLILFVFLIYSLSEGIFIANLSDTVLYVLLFSPKLKLKTLT